MKRYYLIALLLGLSSITSAKADTNLLDLVLVKIDRIPFHLKYPKESTIQVGTNLHGFVVTKMIPKTEKMQLPSGEFITVDVSELILKRGERTITITRGEAIPYNDVIVQFIDTHENKEYSAGIGDEVSIRSRKMRIQEVNESAFSCTLEDVATKEQFNLKMKAQQTP